MQTFPVIRGAWPTCIWREWVLDDILGTNFPKSRTETLRFLLSLLHREGFHLLTMNQAVKRKTCEYQTCEGRDFLYARCFRKGNPYLALDEIYHPLRQQSQTTRLAEHRMQSNRPMSPSWGSHPLRRPVPGDSVLTRSTRQPALERLQFERPCGPSI